MSRERVSIPKRHDAQLCPSSFVYEEISKILRVRVEACLHAAKTTKQDPRDTKTTKLTILCAGSSSHHSKNTWIEIA